MDRRGPAARGDGSGAGDDTAGRLEVDGVRVTFGDVAAVDGFDLVVAPAEVVAVLGPSGSGKSTLLRAVAGLEPLARGRIRIDGRDLARTPPHRRGVGLMFQDQVLFPHRDVGANVGFGLRMQRRPPEAVRRRVSELLELVGLPGTERRAVRTLSGGEQQRVALARALAPEPRVLLLDEPFGALDRVLRERLVTEVRALITRLGLTVVAVTHDQSEAFALADRIAVIDEGRLLRVGTAPDVWTNPGTAQVARLLGFTNVASAEIADGVARTPWGDVPTDGAGSGVAGLAEVEPGHHDLLVRPTAVCLGTEGAPALVDAAVFQGDRVRVRLDVDGSLLEAVVDTALAPRAGDQVHVTLDPAGIAVLDPAPADESSRD